MSANLRAEVAEVLRGYLRAYTLPANVVGYFGPADNHDTVAERCAQGLTDALAPLLARREAEARAEGERAVWAKVVTLLGSDEDRAALAARSDQGGEVRVYAAQQPDRPVKGAKP